MPYISTRGNKITGFAFLIFGVLIIFLLFYSSRSEKLFITFLFGGVSLIFFGILYLVGYLVPENEANPYEKAKRKVFSSIFNALFFLLLLIEGFSIRGHEISKTMIIVIGLASTMILFYIWYVFFNLNKIKTFKKGVH